MNRKLIVVIFAVILALSACHGGEISGKYAGTKCVGTNLTMEFKSNNAVYVTIMLTGDTMKTTYEVDGDRVSVHLDQANVVFTRGQDGALRSTGVFGDTLKCSAPKTGGMSGKYRNELPNGAVTLEFYPDYTASLIVWKATGAMSGSVPTTYTIDGDKIHLRLPQGESVFTKSRDGSLTSSTNALFKKVN
jgi:hypothetical protein